MSGFVYPDLPKRMDAVREAVQWAAGINAVWRDQDDGGIVRRENRAWIELRPRRIQRVGWDDRRHVDLETPDTEGTLKWPRQELLVSWREIYFEARFRSRTQEHDCAAWYYAARMQTRLQSSYLKEKWLSGNLLAIADIGDVINMPDTLVFQNRREDIAIVEFTLNATLCEEDGASVGSWIDRVLVTSNIKCGDTPIDASLQLNDDVMGWPYGTFVIDKDGKYVVDKHGAFVQNK